MSIVFFIPTVACAVLMSVPVAERNVLGRHLDVARPRFHQPPRQQTALPEPARVVDVVRAFGSRDRSNALAEGDSAAGAPHRATASDSPAGSRCHIGQRGWPPAAACTVRSARESLRRHAATAARAMPHPSDRQSEPAHLAAQKAGRVKRLHRSASPPISRFCPMSINAGMSGFRPQRPRDQRPRCGAATVCGGTYPVCQ